MNGLETVINKFDGATAQTPNSSLFRGGAGIVVVENSGTCGGEKTPMNPKNSLIAWNMYGTCLRYVRNTVPVFSQYLYCNYAASLPENYCNTGFLTFNFVACVGINIC